MAKQPKSKKRKSKFAKRTVTALDWLLLPITEIRYLKNSVGALVRMTKEISIFSWAAIRVNSKDLLSSEFYKRIANKTGPQEFAENLTYEQHEFLASNLSKLFLRKRFASIAFVFVVFLLGVLFFGMSYFVTSVSLFRMVVLLAMLLSVGAYLFVSMTHYENLRYYFYNYLSQGIMPKSLDSKIKLLKDQTNE